MNNHNCKLCHSHQSIFTIQIPIEDSEETFDQFVCGPCWEIIAEIAGRKTNARLEKLEAQVARLLEAVPSAGEVKS